MTEFLSEDRVKVLRRLLFVVLGLAGLLLLLGVVFWAGGDGDGGAVVLAVGAVDALLAGASLRAVEQRSGAARRLVIATGVVTMVLSVLIIGILVGLLTVVAGVGLLVIAFAPEQEPR